MLDGNVSEIFSFYFQSLLLAELYRVNYMPDVSINLTLFQTSPDFYVSTV